MATVPVQPTTTNTHISTNFARLLEPGLRKIFFETYGELPEQYSKVFKMNKSTKAKETDYGLGAFGDWEKRTDELDTVKYGKLSAGQERVYIHEAFTKGFMIGRELYDDEQYSQMNKMPKALARAGRAKVERDAVSVLVKGFDKTTRPIYDGEALFSNAHPLVDNATVKGKNLATGALTDENLKVAMRIMREQVDEAGGLIQMRADTLVIPPALEFTARKILESVGESDTNLNNANTVKGALKIVVLDYLGANAGGSDTAWYLMDSKRHELNFFWRVRPEFKAEEEFDNFVAKYRGYMRYSYGVSDWRGVVGSTGVPATRTVTK